MDSVERRIESFLRSGEGMFETLSLDLFAYQFSQNEPYRAYCEAQKLTPSTVTRWRDVPAVPVQAFKSTALATFPVERAAAVFESSRTTQGIPSRHYLKTLSYYEASLQYTFDRLVRTLDQTVPFLILTPPPGEAPHSSLTWMFEVLRRTRGANGSEFLVRRDRLDDLRLTSLLRRQVQSGQPVFLMGTTLAFLAFFEQMKRGGSSFRLPIGSHVLDTGGMKSEKREVTRAEFIAAVHDNLGVPADGCVSEYGMCEMSSQLYGWGVKPLLVGPPWLRTLVIDRATGGEAKTGTPGLLRHWDLANVDSVAALQTEDVGIQHPNGIELLGRDRAALLKGCSLGAEALFPAS